MLSFNEYEAPLEKVVPSHLDTMNRIVFPVIIVTVSFNFVPVAPQKVPQEAVTFEVGQVVAVFIEGFGV